MADNTVFNYAMFVKNFMLSYKPQRQLVNTPPKGLWRGPGTVKGRIRNAGNVRRIKAAQRKRAFYRGLK